MNDGVGNYVVEKLKNIVNDNITLEDNKLLNEKLLYLLENFVQSDLVSLFIYDKNTKRLNHTLFYDRSTGNLNHIEHDDDSLLMIDPKGCIGKVFLTKSSAIYNNITSDKEYIKEYDNFQQYNLKAQMIMPIIEDDILLGIVRMSAVVGGKLKEYTQKELEFFKASEVHYVNIIKKLTSSSYETVSTKSDSEVDSKMELALTETEDVTINDNSMLLFLSNTVHDIRTPANSLYGFLELLEEQIEDKRLKNFVTNAKESASFINTLTDSILETTKNRYESTMVKTETITTKNFLSEIANTFSAKMLEKKIHYFIYISPKVPKEIKIDTLKLKRILINLIGNAYKFTPVKHQIDVQINWDELNSRIKFSVKDTGIGIEEEDQKKLFKAFSQACDDTNEKYGGTGLGLAISATYVSDLGGELKLESRIDEGSEFYFDIPVEIIDENPSYEKFYNLKKKITILTDYVEAKYPKFIRQYIIDLGMPEEKIYISDTIEDTTTHVICFEEKMTDEVLNAGRLEKFKLLLIEQKLFSLLNMKGINDFHVTSKNTYNGDALHSIVFSGNKIKVLIVDDNKINISLLESILETKYVEIDTCLDGETALKTLKNASENECAYNIIYLDKFMPGISGTELLSTFRDYEKKNKLKPIFAVSITGDPDISEVERNLFNAFVTKPFNKNDVRGIIELVKSKQ